VTTVFAFVTPTAFYPIMCSVATYRTGYTNFVAFGFKVIATIRLAGKMGTETENSHNFFAAKIIFFIELWIITDNQKKLL